MAQPARVASFLFAVKKRRKKMNIKNMKIGEISQRIAPFVVSHFKDRRIENAPAEILQESVRLEIFEICVPLPIARPKSEIVTAMSGEIFFGEPCKEQKFWHVVTLVNDEKNENALCLVVQKIDPDSNETTCTVIKNFENETREE